MIFNRKSIIILFCLALFIGFTSLTFVSANEYTASGNFTNLSTEIGKTGQGDTVNLTGDVTRNISDTTESQSYYDGINITKNLTIDGKGHTIDGKDNGRIFNITNDSSVTLKNMIITGGKHNLNGGAIYNGGTGTLTLINVTFTKNTATWGGAIYTTSGSVTITNNSSLYNNTAQHGGAIFTWSGSVTITNDSVLSYNTAYSGGVINAGGNVTITNNSSLYNNTATSSGGAIYTEYGNVTINGSELYNNTAQFGGAISTWDGGSVTITNNSRLYNNTAQFGGAIYTDTGNVTINGSLLSYNTANSDGGAIFTDTGSVIINGSSLYNNTATQYGGAIYTYDGGVTITGSELYNNTALVGGAIFTNGGDLNITGSILVNNKNSSKVNAIHINSASNAPYLEDNWWGNNITTKDTNPNSTYISSISGGSVGINSWLVLNISANPTTININDKSTVNVTLNRDKNGKIVDNFNFTTIPVSLTTTIGNLSSTKGELIKQEFNTIFTAKDTNPTTATVTATIYGISTSTEIITLNDTVYVNDTGNDTNGDGSITNPVKTIERAMEIVSSDNEKRKIIVNGTINTTGTDSSYTGVVINKTVTIVGVGNSSINGNGNGRIFKITNNANLTLENITINGGNFTGNGGAIYNNGTGTLTLTNVTFTNNTATNGSAIYTNNATVNITASIFYDNNATIGGVIYIAGGNLTINGTIAHNNNGTIGGVIYNNGTGTLTLTNVTLTNNTATNGSVIYSSDGTVNITASIFYDNNATGSGGVIFFDGGNLNITGSILVNNLNSSGGNAIHINTSGTVHLDNNWWGNTNNTNPNATYISYGSGVSGVPVEYWMVLNITATTPIYTNERSTITVSLNSNKAGATVDAFNFTSMPLNLNTTLGTLSSDSGTLNSSQNFTTTFTLSSAGQATVNVTIYGVSTSTQITINNRPIVPITTTTTVTVSPGSGRFGDNITIKAITSYSYGTVYFYINNTLIRTSSVRQGTASILWNVNKEEGNYTIKAVYYPNSPYTDSHDTVNFTIEPLTKDTKLIVENITIVYGDEANFTVTLIDDNNKSLIARNITININGIDKNYTTNNNGTVSLSLDLDAGNYTAYVYFAGDSEYKESNSTSTIVVNKSPTIIIAQNITMEYNDGSNFTTKLIDSFNQSIVNVTLQISVNNVTYNLSTNSEGEVSLDINLNSGTYTIFTSFSGNENYLSSNITNNLEVNKGRVILEANNLTMEYKDGTQFTVKVLDSNNNPIRDVVVQISVNTRTYNCTTDSDGLASLDINLNSGNYTIYSVFNGDDNYLSSNTTNNLEVKKREILLEASDLTMEYKDGTKFTAKLMDTFNRPIVNVTVQISVNTRTYNCTTDSDGLASLNINLRSGNYTVYSVFNGGDNYFSSNITNNLEVKKREIILEASDITMYYKDGTKFTSKLVDKFNQAIANVTVQISVNTRTYNRTTDSNGLASLNINLNSGNYTVYSVFNGGDNYFSSNTTNNLEVKKREILLEASDLTMEYKDGTQFTVKVLDSNNNPIPGFIVQISVNTKTYNCTSDSNGIAGLDINLLPKNYTVTAGVNDWNYICEDVSANLTVNSWNISKVTLLSNPLTKYFEDSNRFSAVLYYDGNLIKGEDVIITANGKNYTKKTDENGTVYLDVNLNTGNYNFTVTTTVYGLTITNTSEVIVLKNNLSINASPSVIIRHDYLTVTLSDLEGKLIKNLPVVISVNGVDYLNYTDSNGQVKLQFNLLPREYKVNIAFDGNINYNPVSSETMVTVVE